MVFLSPLEQFEIFPYLTFLFKGSTFVRDYFLISNLDVSFFIAFFEFLFLKWFFLQSSLLFQNITYIMFELIILISSNMIFNMVGKEAKQILPLLLCLFCFILVFNVLGLIPFGFCITSQIIITQFLGLLAIGGLTFKGIEILGFKFLNLFVPRNVPVFMIPFLSLIEIISFISRTLSLSIRLFANMVAGHALLHILMGALLSLFTFSIVSSFILIIFFILSLLIFAILLLEIGIAFLQAYVFVVLFLIYLNDSYKTH